MIPLDSLKYLRFSTVSFLQIFYIFSTFSTRALLTSAGAQSVGNTICSGIEVVITRTTRNRLIGDEPVRGFESHPLRQSGLRRVFAAAFFTLRIPPCAGTSRSLPLRTVPGLRSPDGHRCRRWLRKCCGPTISGFVSWGFRCSEASWRRYALMA